VETLPVIETGHINPVATAPGTDSFSPRLSTAVSSFTFAIFLPTFGGCAEMSDVR